MSETALAGRRGLGPTQQRGGASKAKQNAPNRPSASSTAASAGACLRRGLGAVPGACGGGRAQVKTRERGPTSGGWACIACPLGGSLLVVAVLLVVVALVAAAGWADSEWASVNVTTRERKHARCTHLRSARSAGAGAPRARPLRRSSTIWQAAPRHAARCRKFAPRALFCDSAARR